MLEVRRALIKAEKEKDWDGVDRAREQYTHVYHRLLNVKYEEMTTAPKEKASKKAEELFDFCREVFNQSLYYADYSLMQEAITYMKHAQRAGKMGNPRIAIESGEYSQDELNHKHRELESRADKVKEQLQEMADEINRATSNPSTFDEQLLRSLLSRSLMPYHRKNEKDYFYKEFVIFETTSAGVELYELVGQNYIALKLFMEANERTKALQ
jgi:hypothetical protein